MSATAQGDAEVLSDPAYGDDPMRALERTGRAMQRLAPYRFTDDGGARLEGARRRLLESGEPASRLVLARALLDAALLAEVGDHEALRRRAEQEVSEVIARVSDGAQAPESVWSGLALVFAQAEAELREAGPRYAAHAEAAREGGALVALLRERRMDAAYHARLNALATGDGLFAVQARIARILDVAEALDALHGYPLDGRAETLLRVVGGQVCASGEARCDVACPEGAARAAQATPARREVVLLATCGYAEMGWPSGAHEALYNAELGQVARVLRGVRLELEGLVGLRGHPSAQAARADLLAVAARLEREGLPVGLRLEEADDVDALALPVATTPPPKDAPLWWEGVGGRFVVVDGELGVRVGVVPVLGLAAEGGVRFLEADAGWAFPGRWVASAEALGAPRGAEAEAVYGVARSHVVEAWGEARGVLSEVGARDAAVLGSARSPAVPIWLPADADVARVRGGLELVRAALGRGAGLDARVWVWEPSLGQMGWRPVRVLQPGSLGADAWTQGLPMAARPLDVVATLTGEGVVVTARGREVGRLGVADERDGAALEALLTKALGGRSPDGLMVDVEVAGEGVVVGRLVGVIEALGASGRVEVVLFGAGEADERRP